MSTPALTIVIPTHNRRELLGLTLDSVLAEQGVDVRLVVVNDNSTDDTHEWLDAHADRRVQPLHLSPGRGGSGARNAGLERIATPFVMFMDDDDLLCKGGLRLLAEALAARPAADGSVGSHRQFGPVNSPYQQPSPLRTCTATTWREQIWGWNMQPGASLWRTSAVRAMGGWDEALMRCEDLDFNLRMYPRKVAVIRPVVLHYRAHPRDVEEARHAAQHALAAEVKRRFVDSLSGKDRRQGEQVIEARAMLHDALYAYTRGDYRTAARGFGRGLRIAPFLAMSPILGPWLVGLAGKATLASAAPGGVHRSVRQFRQTRRARRFGTTSPS
jgi:glycosyltransferase involved in cell wall biosynthesis